MSLTSEGNANSLFLEGEMFPVMTSEKMAHVAPIPWRFALGPSPTGYIFGSLGELEELRHHLNSCSQGGISPQATS